MTCTHAKMRSIVLHLKGEGMHRAVLAISCHECGAKFRFADGDGAIMFNDERTEMSAWIVQAGEGK